MLRSSLRPEMRFGFCSRGAVEAPKPSAAGFESAPQRTPPTIFTSSYQPRVSGGLCRSAPEILMDTIPETPAQILVIDDNHDEVQKLREALTECGEPYELSILRDGEAALRFVADHRLGLRQPEPCVIVLDLNLPKHDALAVLAAIRSEPALSHIKVLVVSARAVPEIQALLRAMGGFIERGRGISPVSTIWQRDFWHFATSGGPRGYAPIRF
jgi:CheY-like chemotaxis protein